MQAVSNLPISAWLLAVFWLTRGKNEGSQALIGTGSLFRFPYYLQAPFFNFHVIYSLPFSIYPLFTASLLRFPSVLFTDSLFRFPCYLQAPFFNLRAIYRLPVFDFHVIYRLFQFTCYLKPFYSIRRNNLHLIYMIPSLCSENLQCFRHYLHVSLKIYICFLHGTSETCKRGKSCKSFIMLIKYSVNFQLFQ